LSQEKMWPDGQRAGDRHGTRKLDAKGKRAPAGKLLAQADEDEAREPIGRW